MQINYLLRYYSILLLLFLSGCLNDTTKDQPTPTIDSTPNKVLTLYTSRYFTLDKTLFDQFANLYKIKVNVVLDTPENLIQRLKKEASNPKADVVLMSNLQDIYALKEAKLLTTFSDETLDNNTHSRNQDKQGTWIGLSKWAIGVGGAHERVSHEAFTTYKDLTRPDFKEKIVLSSSKNKSNQFLVASMLVTEGEAVTRSWIKGIMANLALPAVPTDIDAVKAVGQGYADISIINASAMIQYQQSGSTEDYDIGSNVGIKFPVNSKGGTYYNLTPIGIVKGTRNYQEALSLILFLMDKNQQPKFCQTLHEYPMNVFTELDDFILSIGGFREETINFNKVFESIPKAISIMQEYNWK